MLEAVNQLNSLSPLAVIGLLAYVILLQLKNQRGQSKIANNHLHDLPDMMAALERIENLLGRLNDHVVHIRARVNGDHSKK